MRSEGVGEGGELSNENISEKMEDLYWHSTYLAFN